MFCFPNVQANTTRTHHSYIQVAVSHTQDHIFQILNFCYSSQNFIQVIKSSTVIWTGHAARMTEEVHAGFRWGNLKEKDYLEDLGIDARLLLKLNFKSLVGRTWTGLI